MTRLDYWPRLLDDYIRGAKNVPFKWGSHDCCLFANGAVLAITGVNLMAPFVYDDEPSALRVMLVLGQSILGAVRSVAAQHELEEINPLRAQRGDLVVLHSPLAAQCGIAGQAVGVIGMNGKPTAAAQRGTVERPISDLLCAWRI